MTDFPRLLEALVSAAGRPRDLERIAELEAIAQERSQVGTQFPRYK